MTVLSTITFKLAANQGVTTQHLTPVPLEYQDEGAMVRVRS
jgi:hypothetical protein